MRINGFDLTRFGTVSRPIGMLDLNLRTAGEGGGATFRNQLSRGANVRANANAGPIRIQLPGENCVYTGGIKGNRVNQSVYVSYTEESTADDPIVRIRGEADSGSFDFTCHINEIDPRGASYAELSALYGHLVKTGEYQGGGGAVTPLGYEFYGSRDMLEKQDFIAGLSALSVSSRIDPRGRADAKYMLSVYENFARDCGQARTVTAFTHEVQKDVICESEAGAGSYETLGELMTAYREWKALQPGQSLPGGQGLTGENISYLRERYGGELSLFQKIEALDTLQQMGIITRDQQDAALGRNMKYLSAGDTMLTVLPLDEGDQPPAEEIDGDSWFERFQQQALILSKDGDLDMLLGWIDTLAEQPA